MGHSKLPLSHLVLCGTVLFSLRGLSPDRSVLADETGPGYVFLPALQETRAPGVEEETEETAVETAELLPVTYQEPRARTPETSPRPVPGIRRTPTTSGLLRTRIGASLLSERRRSTGRAGRTSLGGSAAGLHVATDAGSLLGKSSSPGVAAQRRSPIIAEPRVRGSRIGTLGASGSHWVPARIDLDTAASKLDPHLISQLNVIKGPYSAAYGPGTSFIDFELVTSPRSTGGRWFEGLTRADFQSNGKQHYARQSLSIADEQWGARVGYGNRGGTDYREGGGDDVPASYHSQDFDAAFGFDFGPDRTLEVIYLRQDQTDVELAGQAFDLGRLTTDAAEITWTDQSVTWSDFVEVETWYNNTDLQGSFSRSVRRLLSNLFPSSLDYRTDVDSLSTGGRIQSWWGVTDTGRLTIGTDVRVVRQGLEETGIAFGAQGARSPIPRAATASPGLFVELIEEASDELTVTAGARYDYVASEVTADAARIADLNRSPPLNSVSAFLGTNDLDQSFQLWSAYLTADYALDANWTLSLAAGHGQRAPNLTELYATVPFSFVMQNGINTVTGNPFLDPERRTQIDVGISGESGRFSGGVNAWHAWVEDFITFENLRVFRNLTTGNRLEQVNLGFVNTELAVLNGIEAEADYELASGINFFGAVSFVEGTDRTRTGDDVTRIYSRVANPASQFGISDTFFPVQRLPGEARGSNADPLNPQTLPNEEPLPGIPPLDTLLGIRFSDDDSARPWSIALSTRIVDAQERVALSLEELPTSGFTVWDLRGYWQATEQFTLSGGIENLTDRAYQEHLDFRLDDGTRINRPGINFYMSAQLAY